MMPIPAILYSWLDLKIQVLQKKVQAICIYDKDTKAADEHRAKQAVAAAQVLVLDEVQRMVESLVDEEKF